MTIEEARKVLDGELLVLTLENNVANEAQKSSSNVAARQSGLEK